MLYESSIKTISNDININELNVLKLKDSDGIYLKLKAKAISNLLCINKNNYSVQEICLDIKCFKIKMIIFYLKSKIIKIITITK